MRPWRLSNGACAPYLALVHCFSLIPAPLLLQYLPWPVPTSTPSLQDNTYAAGAGLAPEAAEQGVKADKDASDEADEEDDGRLRTAFIGTSSSARGRGAATSSRGVFNAAAEAEVSP